MTSGHSVEGIERRHGSGLQDRKIATAAKKTTQGSEKNNNNRDGMREEEV